MFSHAPKTSHGRYNVRKGDWFDYEGKIGLIKHRFWWMIHNVIAHIGIGLFPNKYTFRFHDFTSYKLMTYTNWK